MSNHDELAKAVEDLKELPIPPAFDSDALEDLRADLIGLDSFYAGIASTVLDHGRVEYPLHDLNPLRVRFREAEPDTENDRRARLAAINYLDHLDRARSALQPFVSGT